VLTILNISQLTAQSTHYGTVVIEQDQKMHHNSILWPIFHFNEMSCSLAISHILATTRALVLYLMNLHYVGVIFFM
jgi:hypothetical protein